MDKPLFTLRKRREKTQITKIRDEKENITTLKYRTYFESLYYKTMENLEDINKFLQIYDLQKLNQEDIENLSRSISSNEIEDAIKILPTKKSQGPDRFSAEF